MFDWIRENWDKLLATVLTVGGILAAAYRRFIRIEDRVTMIEKTLREHIEEDVDVREKIERKMDAMVADIRDLAVKMSAHEAVLRETGESVREVRNDIKELLRRRG